MQHTLTFAAYSDYVRPELLKHVQAGLTQVDLWDNITQVPGYSSAFMGGKQLRGCLLMFVFDAISLQHLKNAESLKSVRRKKALDLAAAVQIAHGASLIVDDMIDDDLERRGKPSHHATVGQKVAMLDTVDALGAAYALTAKAGYNNLYTMDLSSVQRSMVSGVIRESIKQHVFTATSLYNLMITQKTGSLFSLCGKWGAHTAGAGPATVRDFEAYALNLGLAMQMADDIADLSRIGATGKMSGFGSELFLLRCLTVDGLVKEMVEDIKSMHPHPSKIKYFMSQSGVTRELDQMLQDKIHTAEKCMQKNREQCELLYWQALLRAPTEIAQMMKKEQTGDSKNP